MKESFLHYIWHTQYFSKARLHTHDFQGLTILEPGKYNLNSGPDFHLGRIKINNEELIGHIEIHVRSNDWYVHHHEKDPAYDQVILHVVWEFNREVLRIDGSRIPTLELKNLISPYLLDRSSSFFNTLDAIVCRKFLARIRPVFINNMIYSSLRLRLSNKASHILQLYQRRNMDWNETFYSLLLKNFGFKVNSYAFERIAQKLPFKILRKHSSSLFQIEALLFGVSGLLTTRVEDEYFMELRKEFAYLKHKYKLGESLSITEWKFSRMRPTNFPTLRLAQIAAILHGRVDFFNDLLDLDFERLVDILRVKPSQYWKNHYKFGSPVKNSISGIGMSSVVNLIINSIIPFKYTFAHHQNDELAMNTVVDLLKTLQAEDNKIVRVWKESGLSPLNAFESQGLYALYQNYCRPNRCLQCEIGHSIIAP